VRWGERGALTEYALLIAVAYAVPLALFASRKATSTILLPLITLPFAVRLARRVGHERGRALNPLLKQTAMLLLAYGVLFSIGLVFMAFGFGR
jgi:1,4-dihydroxy-2-naphthoate octaprenyltransferase